MTAIYLNPEFLENLYSPKNIHNIKVYIQTDLWFILMRFISEEYHPLNWIHIRYFLTDTNNYVNSVNFRTNKNNCTEWTRYPLLPMTEYFHSCRQCISRWGTQLLCHEAVLLCFDNHIIQFEYVNIIDVSWYRLLVEIMFLFQFAWVFPVKASSDRHFLANQNKTKSLPVLSIQYTSSNHLST